jgi:hypothetical protein
MTKSLSDFICYFLNKESLPSLDLLYVCSSIVNTIVALFYECFFKFLELPVTAAGGILDNSANINL